MACLDVRAVRVAENQVSDAKYLFRSVGMAVVEEDFDRCGAKLLPEFMVRELGDRRLGQELEDGERCDGVSGSEFGLWTSSGEHAVIGYLVV